MRGVNRTSHCTSHLGSGPDSRVSVAERRLAPGDRRERAGGRVRRPVGITCSPPPAARLAPSRSRRCRGAGRRHLPATPRYATSATPISASVRFTARRSWRCRRRTVTSSSASRRPVRATASPRPSPPSRRICVKRTLSKPGRQPRRRSSTPPEDEGRRDAAGGGAGGAGEAANLDPPQHRTAAWPPQHVAFAPGRLYVNPGQF